MDHTAVYGHFVCHATQRILCQFFGYAANLKEHRARLDHRNPVFRFALTLTHTSFQWLSADGLIREYSDVHLTLTMKVVRCGDSAGFDLPGGDPPAFQRLQAELTECYGVSACRVTTDFAALLLAVLNSFWH